MVPQILHFLNLRTCESERFISNEIARSHKIVILLRNANFSFKKAVCLWPITEWKIYFLIFKKILLSFVQKGSRKKSDPFRSDPWFFGSTIRSRSSRRKWIYDPIMILKKEDLDPKGSRSDHDRHISGWSFLFSTISLLLFRQSTHIFLRENIRKVNQSSIKEFYLSKLFPPSVGPGYANARNKIKYPAHSG